MPITQKIHGKYLFGKGHQADLSPDVPRMSERESGSDLVEQRSQESRCGLVLYESGVGLKTRRCRSRTKVGTEVLQRTGGW